MQKNKCYARIKKQMIWAIILLAVGAFLLNSPKQNNKTHYFKKQHIENLTVVFADRETINTWWALIGGKKDWEKVHAFSYYDHKKNIYYIVLPPDADNKLIGYEFSHILEWDNKKTRQTKLPSATQQASAESKTNLTD